MPPVGSDFGHRIEHEAPQVQGAMRHGKPGSTAPAQSRRPHQRLHGEDIDIEHTRSPASLRASSERRLDPLEVREQQLRGQCAVNRDHGIGKAALRRTEGPRVVDARQTQHAQAVDSGNGIDSGGDDAARTAVATMRPVAAEP